MPDASFVKAHVFLATRLYGDVFRASLQAGIPMSEYISRALKEYLRNKSEQEEQEKQAVRGGK